MTLALLLSGLAAAFAWRRRPWPRAIALAVVLAAFFALFVRHLPGPYKGASTTRAALLLAGAIGIFRLMASFEGTSAKRQEPSP